MIEQQTCPHCGAKEHANYGFYLCGTRVADTERRWYPICYQRQLAAKDEEIERLRQAVLDEREACAKLCVHIGATKGNCDQHFDMADECAEQIRARGKA